MNLFTVEDYCRVRYRSSLGADGKPTKSQMNTVAAMCRRGSFKRAFKVGRTWFIDIEAEADYSKEKRK